MDENGKKFETQLKEVSELSELLTYEYYDSRLKALADKIKFQKYKQKFKTINY